MNRYLVSVFFCVTKMGSEVTALTLGEAFKNPRKRKQTIQRGAFLKPLSEGEPVRDMLEMETLVPVHHVAQWLTGTQRF